MSYTEKRDWCKDWKQNVTLWEEAESIAPEMKDIFSLNKEENEVFVGKRLLGKNKEWILLDRQAFLASAKIERQEEYGYPTAMSSMSAFWKALEKETLSSELKASVEDAFAEALSFGTAGLRGKMGLGLNRMNIYSVATATTGIARYLLGRYGKEKCLSRGVVIGYDTRHHSKLFALVGALVFAAHDISVQIFPKFCPTPVLAYSIRPLGALAGIMVTASHNPKEYNGYKIYGEDGIQIGSEEAAGIAQEIQGDYLCISEEEAREKQLFRTVSAVIEEDYLLACLDLVRPYGNENELKIVYTPVHGTGAMYVQFLLDRMGFKQVVTVKEQEQPDPDFPTCPAPNPEFEPALRLALDYAKKEKADLILATDPDADRLAACIPDEKGEYHILSGNEIGGLLCQYWFTLLKEKGALPANGALVKSIVTDTFGSKVAQSFQLHVEECLTGFKNICGKIRAFQEDNQRYQYVFGYEESIGYALHPQVFDKDGISAALVLASAEAFYRKQNLSLWQVLQDLYKQYGYHVGKTLNLVREGQKGLAFMKFIMNKYRLMFPLQSGDEHLLYREDYAQGLRGTVRLDGKTRIVSNQRFHFETSNVLRFLFDGGSWYALRPSGTEPKLKIYMHNVSSTEEEARKKLAVLEKVVVDLLEKLEADFLAQWDKQRSESEK